MRDLGNTLVVVEHDHETTSHSDYLIDIGPRAGKRRRCCSMWHATRSDES